MKSEKSEIRCTNPSCIERIDKYGDNYHDVYNLTEDAHDFMPDAVAKCDRCGGYTNGTNWRYVCQVCGKDVDDKKLYGFFVPHRCEECDKEIVANEKASGQVCLQCGQCYSYCCC